MRDDDGESERPEQQQLAWVCRGGQLMSAWPWNGAVLAGACVLLDQLPIAHLAAPGRYFGLGLGLGAYLIALGPGEKQVNE